MKPNVNSPIPLEFILIISGMPGVGKSTLAINLIKKYSEFRSLNQMNLLRFATRYYEELDNYDIYEKGLRFLTYDEGKKYMLKLAPVIKAFSKRQMDKKIPTILEGIDFNPPCLISYDKSESFFSKVLFVNLYCSEELIHYKRLIKREVQRQNNPASVDSYFKNIRKNNELLHQEILKLKVNNVKSLDVASLNEKQVLSIVEKIIAEQLHSQ